MSNQVQKFGAQYLQQLKPAELVEDENVKSRFIDLYNKLHGSDKGELIYNKEVFNYKKLLAETPALRECSPLSLYGCFLDINVNALSLESGSKPDCYITSRNFNVGTKNEPVWEKRAQLIISPYGELKMRLRAGQIKYADNPVIVYEGDSFTVVTTEKGKVVHHEEKFPKGKKIIASFIRLIRHDGSVDFFVMSENDIERLKAASAKQNKNTGANALYTSVNGGIDPGFLAAKTIKHAFRTYPKVPTGQFSSIEPEDETAAQVIDYGIDPNESSANAVQDIPHEEVKDEFAAALEEENNNKQAEETVSFESSDFDDEPNFD